METILGWLLRLSELDGFWTFIAKPASSLLRRILRKRGGVVRTAGFEFYPNRSTLVAAHGTLAERLKTASTVDAMWVIGQKFYHARENLQVIKRLLLPHPEGEAFKHHSKVSGHAETIRYVRDTTRTALKYDAKVRWYDPFVFHSINLVDTDKPTGWVHVEMVLPYSKVDQRPSFTIYKQHSEQTVSELQRIFDEIWHNADDAPGSP